MKADKKSTVQMLKTARGQIDGILKMIEDNRYCMDISNQLLATQSILKAVNLKVIEAHMQGCVKDAFENGNSEEKMEEILSLLSKLMR